MSACVCVRVCACDREVSDCSRGKRIEREIERIHRCSVLDVSGFRLRGMHVHLKQWFVDDGLLLEQKR